MKAWELESMNHWEREAMKLIDNLKEEHAKERAELQAEIDLLKNKEGRKMELAQYIGLLTTIPRESGMFHYEMSCAVTELHELMGFKKHSKG